MAAARGPLIGLWSGAGGTAARLWHVELGHRTRRAMEQVHLARTAGELADLAGRHARQPDAGPIEVLAHREADLGLLAEAMDLLRAAGTKATLRLRQSIAPPPPPQGLGFAGETRHRFTLQGRIETLLRSQPRITWRLDSATPPLLMPPPVGEVWLRSGGTPADLLEGVGERQIRIAAGFGTDMAGVTRILGRGLLRTLLTESLPAILAVTDTQGVVPFTPYAGRSASSLFIFPDRMVPASRAFFSRGFDLLSGLNAADAPTDVLVFGPPQQAALRQIEVALRTIAPRATAVPLRRAAPSWRAQMIKQAEKRLRQLCGETEPAAVRFSEREALFTSSWHAEQITRAVISGGYRKVILTCAYTARALREARKLQPEIEVACDTHDVFFVADRHANAGTRRFFYSPRMQRRRELAALHDIDLTIAISPSDAQNLHQAGHRGHVIVESGTFEHARIPPTPSAAPSWRFGYIGTSNAQNRMALAWLREIWWPAIMAKLPDAQLRIAGPAGGTPEAQALKAQTPKQVELLGFVRDLRHFYREVEVMLSPITVQGGLNFKSVEALMAGRDLITSHLGARCLASQKGIWVATSATDVGTVLDLILQRGRSEATQRAIQEAAREVYGEKAGFRDLAAWVRRTPENQTPARLGEVASPPAASVLATASRAMQPNSGKQPPR